jgi:hypothetical protein
VDNTSEYGRIYGEIVRGYSEKIIENKTYYFKHPSQAEHFDIYSRYESICEDAKLRGLETEENKVQDAIKGKWWSPDKESQIAILKKTIANLNKTRDKLLFISQKRGIEEQITRNERILITYLKERRDIIGYTIEKYANDKFYDETIIRLTYKNKDLTDRVFVDDNEYYYLTEDIVEQIRNGFNGHMATLTMENMKLVAASGFFQNLIYVCDTNPNDFWGKPAAHCTRYQIDLLIYGKMIKNLIKSAVESGNPLNEDTINDARKLVAWVDGQTGGNSTARSSSSGQTGKTAVSSYVGATKEDLKQLGVKVEKIGGKSLLEMARENGGTLEKSQYLNARENM